MFSGEMMEKFLEAALRIVGPAVTTSQDGPGAILKGHLEQALCHSLMWVISIGTNDIQLSLIARKALGMPR
jgi:alkylation response protein AidB-like acyl-CoA dehydrogenase